MTSTIPAALARAAACFGPRYEHLLAEARRVARALIAGGLRPGDRLALWAPNSAEWVQTALGVAWAGGTLVPVNTRFTAVEALDIIERSHARGLVVVGPFRGADRLAGLRATGATLPGLIVSIPGGWADFLASGTRCRRARPTPARRRSRRTTSPTSCSPRARPGAARV